VDFDDSTFTNFSNIQPISYPEMKFYYNLSKIEFFSSMEKLLPRFYTNNPFFWPNP